MNELVTVFVVRLELELTIETLSWFANTELTGLEVGLVGTIDIVELVWGAPAELALGLARECMTRSYVEVEVDSDPCSSAELATTLSVMLDSKLGVGFIVDVLLGPALLCVTKSTSEPLVMLAADTVLTTIVVKTLLLLVKSVLAFAVKLSVLVIDIADGLLARLLVLTPEPVSLLLIWSLQTSEEDVEDRLYA